MPPRGMVIVVIRTGTSTSLFFTLTTTKRFGKQFFSKNAKQGIFRNVHRRESMRLDKEFIFPKVLTLCLTLCAFSCEGFRLAAISASSVDSKLWSQKQWNLPDSFECPREESGKFVRPKRPEKPIRVTSLDQLRSLIKEGYRVPDLDVRGDTLRLHSDIHPVVAALHRRAKSHSTEGRTDGMKIAVAIEGGELLLMRHKKHCSSL